jgi:hypothetical protein
MSFQAWAASWSAYTVATSGRIVPSSSSRAILPSTSPDGASLIIAPDTRRLAVSSCDTGWVAETRWPPAFKTRNDRFCVSPPTRSKTRVVKVSSHSGIELEEAAQAIATVNGLAFRRYVHGREEEKITFALVVAFKMMMFNVLSQRSAQRSFTKENELGQAFLPDRAYPSLGKSVQIWTSRRQSQWPYTTGSQDV